MKNLEQILSENMLRFGVKNLSKENITKLKLNEQYANVGAQDEYRVPFVQTLVEQKLDPQIFEIQAEFYNNMVSLDKGLMSGNVEEKINEIVAAVKGPTFNAKAFKVELIGQATSANPGMKGPKGVALDHPGGKPYGGMDISKEENKQAGNEYLAKQRAESIKARLLTALNAAGVNKRLPDLDKRITTVGKVVPGGAAAKGLRIIKVVVYVPQATNNPTWFDPSFCTVTVSYRLTYIKWPNSGVGGDVLASQQQYMWEPGVNVSCVINFGHSGLPDTKDFTLSNMKRSAIYGWGSGADGTGTPLNLGNNGLDPNGKAVNNYVENRVKGTGTFKPVKANSPSGGRQYGGDDGYKSFIAWLESNGHVTKAQWGTAKANNSDDVCGTFVKKVFEKAGVSVPFSRAAILKDYPKFGPEDPDMNPKIPAPTDASKLKEQQYEATISFQQFIEICGGTLEANLDKTLFPKARLIDTTKGGMDTTVLEDSKTPPGKLPADASIHL